MKKNNRYYAFISLLFCFAVSASTVFAGQTKLHIATNKETYISSETVQFQIFLLNPSPEINNTAFIELLDCYGNKLAKKMLPFNLNISSGSINLPASSKAGFYLLYCYVNNQDSMECSSVKKIFIQHSIELQPGKSTSKINIDHFFEGGTFVAESPNNILLHCTDENANSVAAKGRIIDDKKAVYAVFETNKLGFAKIIFNPENAVRYYVVMKDQNANESTTPLPFAAASGITLNADITPTDIVYSLISYTAADADLPEYRIEILQSGLTVYDAVIGFQPGLSAVKESLKKDSFPVGFLTLRVSDKMKKIYAQRVIYNSGKAAETRLITIIDTVNKREARVMLPDIISGKSYVNILPANSAAADNPGLNFLEVTDNIPVNDQLIALPGLATDQKTEDKSSNRYLSLSGTLMNEDRKPMKNKNITLVILQKNLKKQYTVTKTDKEGKLKIDNLIFFDTATVYYQLADKSEEKNNVYLELRVNPDAGYINKKNVPFNFNCNLNLSHTDNAKFLNPDEKTLSQLVITADKEKTESEKYADKYVGGQMKRSQALRNEFDFIKNPETIDNKSLFTFLQTRIASLRIFTSAFGDVTITGTNGGTVGVYLNDMELPLNESMDIIKDLQVKDVALVKFYSMSFKPKIIGGNPLMNSKASDAGDLMIYTKRDYFASDKTKGLPKTTVVGYDPQDVPGNAKTLQDNGGSLFWKPNWKVEAGQFIYIDLPKASTEKKYEIIMEGINNYLAPYHFKQNLVFN